MIAEVKKKYSLSNSEIASQLGLSYATLMRWRRRLAKGQLPVEKPGPKKVEPLDLGQLRQKILDLEHAASDEAVGQLGCMAPSKTPSPAESWTR